ncbi:calcium/calmodulin-dependent protein kinase type IV-like [Acanthaster planci]|uniref:Calcium/calmodulin-dependent protein kinase type IV n=1 Tax=Acanthaster planci TaxID=133434 RepID=A0A8B7ZRY5_ACAPL|nr:calcium/calmodulin-dependent protein kinase type IV-like [Acanthaster planci]
MPASSTRATPDGGSRFAHAMASSRPVDNTWIEDSKKVETFEEAYKIGKELGRGATSVVLRCTQVGTDKAHAVKVIKKTVDHKVVKTETDILLKLKHPNIIRLKEIFETEEKLFLVLELVTGGELFDRIVTQGYYCEKDAANVVRQLCSAVKYLHENGIVHRDLKPENLLYADNSENASLKLADFGLAKMLHKDVQMQTVCGTPGYCAPEVLLGRPYSPAVDMWSVGVITYILLCGFEPFYDEKGDRYVYKKILKAEYEFMSPWWDNVSQSAKIFIESLLVLDRNKRLTAAQALEHPWVKGTVSKAPLQLAENIKEFNAKRKLKAVTNAVIMMKRLHTGEWKTPIRPRAAPPSPPTVETEQSVEAQPIQQATQAE